MKTREMVKTSKLKYGREKNAETRLKGVKLSSTQGHERKSRDGRQARRRGGNIQGHISLSASFTSLGCPSGRHKLALKCVCLCQAGHTQTHTHTQVQAH